MSDSRKLDIIVASYRNPSRLTDTLQSIEKMTTSSWLLPMNESLQAARYACPVTAPLQRYVPCPTPIGCALKSMFIVARDTVEALTARIHEALDLCVECKACKSECSSGVDVAKVKYEVLSA